MNIEIKNIKSKTVFKGNFRNQKFALVKAVQTEIILDDAYLEGANLKGANLKGANLKGANLKGANLKGASLEGANLKGANLKGANLKGANLKGANLKGASLEGANLMDANLEGANLKDALLERANLMDVNFRNVKHLPEYFIHLCSRDMLFVFQYLELELPGLRKALTQGKIDGSQYDGTCACLIGTVANQLPKNGDNLDKVCSMIPYYTKGTHNHSENWFLNIHKGDTPKNSFFVKHAVKLIDQILKNGQ